MKQILLPLTFAALLLAGCASAPQKTATAGPEAQDLVAAQPPAAPFRIDYQKYELPNGLEVILHEDHSDPIVAVATLVHVGSHREKPGRTGFAHFFEHMSFNDSENVPRGANRKMIEELGGIRNGFTTPDGTGFYEVVPKDAFEKILWIDSDRLGYMINTVTEAALEREKQVVKNEKRQRVDNAPYGHTSGVLQANLYPPDHPYHWTVIGSLRDLQNATLADVKEFYDRYYGANNATLVIAGDVDLDQTKMLVEKWFGEIRRGPEVEPLAPMPVRLEAIRSLYYEDNFAKLPELRMAFPTVEQYHPDAYPLRVLGRVLAETKLAPLYNVVVEERQLAPEVVAFHDRAELAGEFHLRVRANAGVDLDDVKAAIDEGLARFERDGFSEGELRRIKAEMETSLYAGAAAVLSKAFMLAMYNEYAGDPGFLSVEVERMQAVRREDVIDVYRRYVKDQPFVMTSFVPKGQPELAVAGAELAEVYEEPIVPGAEPEVSAGEEGVYEKTPTKIDRSEPPLGEPPLLTTPEVWTRRLDNGLEVYGIEQSEVPLVAFDLTIRGGHWLDPLTRPGVANLLAELMMEGTRNRTPAELEQAIGLVGASIEVEAGWEEIRIVANTLSRNFEATLALVEEILLEPRWDETEYARLDRELDTRLKEREADPAAIAAVVFRRLLYGDQHILGKPLSGTPDSADLITLDDLRSYYEANFSPSVSTFQVVGDVGRERAMAALSGLASRWPAKEVRFPDYPLPREGRGEQVFFVDVPGAKQSVLRVGKLALSAAADDHNNLTYANQRLGGGASARLFQLLRIQKGYTYGAYSLVGTTLEVAPFQVITSVRSNVTLEALVLLREQLESYGETLTPEEVETTKNQVLKANTRAFESLYAKLGLLGEMSKFDLPMDFLEQDQEELLAMDRDEFRRLIERYMNEDEMFYLVVGDAKTQRDRIAELGYGPPRMLDVYGDPGH